jgi:hypothetical protein
MSRYVWVLVVVVLGSCAALLLFVRTRPFVTDDELAEVLEEVEVIRESLDEVECRRPPLLGPSSERTLPLADLLERDGLLAECWEAVDGLLTPDVASEIPGFDFEVDQSHLAPVMRRLSSLHRGVCSGLPGEVARQAQTPNRCAPYPPKSEAWSQQIADDADPSRLYFAYAVAMIARRPSRPDEDRLRLLVQGMALGRDLSQGPTGLANAMAGVDVENRLAAVLVELLEEITPSPALVAELRDALEILADMPVDVHALLASEGVREVDRSQARTARAELNGRAVYSAAMLSLRLPRTCPSGGNVEECLSQFPYPSPTAPRFFDELGPRFYRDDAVDFIHASTTESYPVQLRRMERTRVHARALQEILHWSTERAEGRCPEVSSWEFEEGESRFYVDRNTEAVYRLVIPGPETSAFYYRCHSERAPQ